MELTLLNDYIALVDPIQTGGLWSGTVLMVAFGISGSVIKVGDQALYQESSRILRHEGDECVLIKVTDLIGKLEGKP